MIYVIELRAVQFGSNWMKKIQTRAKIGQGRWLSRIWLSEELFLFLLFPNLTSS